MTDLLIEGDPFELEAIRVEIGRTLGREAQLEPVTSTKGGELREPLLIGLIVALGGPKVVAAIVTILRNRAAHQEAMKRIEGEQEAVRMDHDFRLKQLEVAGEPARGRWEVQLKLVVDDQERDISLDELALR